MSRTHITPLNVITFTLNALFTITHNGAEDVNRDIFNINRATVKRVCFADFPKGS